MWDALESESSSFFKAMTAQSESRCISWRCDVVAALILGWRTADIHETKCWLEVPLVLQIQEICVVYQTDELNKLLVTSNMIPWHRLHHRGRSPS